MVLTDTGLKQVVYTAVEADEAHTGMSGVATLTDGQAVVNFPSHFQMVTSGDQELIVQTTPHSTDMGGPAVVGRSSEQIVIEGLAGRVSTKCRTPSGAPVTATRMNG